MRRTRLLWTLCLTLLCAVAYAQSTVGGFRAQTEQAFLDYYRQIGLQEKLYLVTDKPYYSAGESIYFSAFLLHPIRFTPAVESSFLYVELISADGRLVSRMKVRGEQGRFANALPLSAKLDAGRYTLRAYTKWMSNFDEAFLFHKEIEVGNYIDDAIQTLISYELLDDRSVVARITLMDNLRKRLTHQALEYTLKLRGKAKSYQSKSDANGLVTLKFRPSNSADDCLRLKVSANNRILERTIQLPSFSEDFSVQFFPEGGNLVAGIPQTVAFKAIGVDGKSVEVEGYICNSKRDTLCNLRSHHRGMGLFLLAAEPNMRYTATITSEKGLTRTFDLPPALSSGCTVQVKRGGGDLLLMKVAATPDYPVSQLAAVVQSRGVVEAVIEDVSRLKRISTARMKSGISLISIVDKEHRQIVAERLVFIDNHHFATADITPDKATFAPREKVSLDLRIRNSRGLPVAGRFVLSVTDAEAVHLDPADETIFSYLLLSSDLKGNIERPAEYFGSKSNQQEFLDLIMLTNGWRRYDVGSILRGESPKPRYAIETTQYITGSVTGLFGKAKNPSIAIFKKGEEMLGHFPLTNTNRFKISGIDMPDTAYYFIQALNRKGSSRSVAIRIDPETFPSTHLPLPRPHFQTYKPSITEELLMGAKEKYYTEGGMRVIDIDAVVVTAKREINYSYSSVIDGFNSLGDELTHYASVYDALQRFRQLEVFGREVRVRKKRPTPTLLAADPEEEDAGESSGTLDEEEGRTPEVLINGAPADISELDTYAMEDITRLAYLDAQEAMGMNGLSSNGLIIMEVRNGGRRINTTNESIAEVLLGGYSKPAEFYAPHYEVPTESRKKDLRTTIAWEPDLRSNAEGAASCSFWTADLPHDYQVVLEGITDEGELCRATCSLQAKE